MDKSTADTILKRIVEIVNNTTLNSDQQIDKIRKVLGEDETFFTTGGSSKTVTRKL